ncbi:hypothetical protein, partial [uncultured Fretibacterium sp.]|uniref:hypothetical protein n=1 Tax=uncultured Fretibacterium sp. TaxID=1678694 RepID=UPI002625EE41
MDASHSACMASAARFHPLRLLSGTDPVLSIRRLSAEAGVARALSRGLWAAPPVRRRAGRCARRWWRASPSS